MSICEPEGTIPCSVYQRAKTVDIDKQNITQESFKSYFCLQSGKGSGWFQSLL